VTVISELKALVRSRKELYNGFRYQFEVSDDILDKLNTFIKTERMCCDFFVFQLTVEENTSNAGDYRPGWRKGIRERRSRLVKILLQVGGLVFFTLVCKFWFINQNSNAKRV
jgi:hypothetical protein